MPTSASVFVQQLRAEGLDVDVNQERLIEVLWGEVSPSILRRFILMLPFKDRTILVGFATTDPGRFRRVFVAALADGSRTPATVTTVVLGVLGPSL